MKMYIEDLKESYILKAPEVRVASRKCSGDFFFANLGFPTLSTFFFLPQEMQVNFPIFFGGGILCFLVSFPWKI